MTDRYTLLLGDCLEKLKKLPDESVDSIVTDPPAGISFMSKKWDDDKGGKRQWIAWMQSVAEECLRILKPGGHALVWAIPRTSHWTATAWEDAGFGTRDCIYHIFGSGFPKSHDIGKAIDKKAGVIRKATPLVRCDGKTQENKDGGGWKQSSTKYLHHPVGEDSTPEARKWDGWGTALKPAVECWWLLRKPFKGTVADNVLKYGTGALNIDACRIEGTAGRRVENKPRNGGVHGGQQTRPYIEKALAEGVPSRASYETPPAGRWPANVVHDGSDEVLEHFPETKSGTPGIIRGGNTGAAYGAESRKPGTQMVGFGDSGSAARFFYCAKASPKERNYGCDGLEERVVAHNLSSNACNRCGLRIKANGSGKKCECGDLLETIQMPTRGNYHPTVKPLALMKYLCRLVTPPDGVVLDPFMGSGSTGIAALSDGFRFIGIEREEEYYQIAEKRIAASLGK